MGYCEQHNIPVDFAKAQKKSPYSMDANLLHISYEGDVLEDPWVPPEEEMWRWTVSPESAPDQAEELTLTFERGDVVAMMGIGSRQQRCSQNLTSAAAPTALAEPILWRIATSV